MKRRVVVTGIGMVTPLGNNVHETGPREWRARIGKIPVAS